MTRSEDFFVRSLTQNGNSCESHGECRHNTSPYAHLLTPGTLHAVLHFQWDNLVLHFKHLETDAGAWKATHFVVRCLMFGSRAVWAQDGAFIPSSRICVTFVSASFRKGACHRMTLLCDFHATTFCSTPPHSDTSLILIPDNENLVNDDTGWNATFHCRRYSARGCTGWLFGRHHPRPTHSWRVEDREHLQWPQPRRNIPICRAWRNAMRESRPVKQETFSLKCCVQEVNACRNW